MPFLISEDADTITVDNNGKPTTLKKAGISPAVLESLRQQSGTRKDVSMVKPDTTIYVKPAAPVAAEPAAPAPTGPGGGQIIPAPPSVQLTHADLNPSAGPYTPPEKVINDQGLIEYKQRPRAQASELALPPGMSVSAKGSVKGPGGLARVDAAVSNYEKVMQASALSGTMQAEKEAAYLDRTERLMRMKQNQNEIADYRRDQLMQAKQTELEAALEEYRSAEIDPDRMWKNKSNAEKALSVLGLFLGGIGSSIGGGQNAALVIYNNALERDMEAQRAEIQKKGRNVDIQSNLLAQMQSRFGDERQAESAARVAMIENSQMKLNALAAIEKSQDRKNNYLEKAALLNVEAQKWRAEYNQAAWAASMKNQAQGVNMRPLPDTAQDQLADAEAAMKQLGEVRRDFREKTGFFSFLTRNIPATDSAEYENAREGLAQTITFMMSGAGATDKERQRFLDRIPSAMTPNGTAKELFDDLEAFLRNKYETRQRQAQAQGYYAPDMQSGAPAPITGGQRIR